MIMIYYKFNCLILCNVLKMICDVGYDLVVVDYLQDGWMCGQFWGLFSVVGLILCQVLCIKEVVVKELCDVGDEVIIVVMIVDLVLVEWFFVCGFGGVWLCCLIDLLIQILIC